MSADGPDNYEDARCSSCGAGPDDRCTFDCCCADCKEAAGDTRSADDFDGWED